MQSVSPLLAEFNSHVDSRFVGRMPNRNFWGGDLGLQYSDFFFFPFLSPSFFFFPFLSANFVFQCLQVDKCLTLVVFKCPCKIAAFFFPLSYKHCLEAGRVITGLLSHGTTLQNMIVYSGSSPHTHPLRFLIWNFCLCATQVKTHLVLEWFWFFFWGGGWFSVLFVFPWELETTFWLATTCLYLWKRVCPHPQASMSFLLKDSLGFVEWSREDCIVGAGLGEHTFLPQTSPFCRKPNKIYTYNFLLSPESRFERKSICASGN